MQRLCLCAASHKPLIHKCSAEMRIAMYHELSPELQEKIISDRKEHRVNPYAFRNEDILRRRMDHDKPKLWRPAFVRDTEKIMHTPFYNRYSDKTQVFSLYKNDDISHRALHVQLVSRIARNIGEILGLNCDLIEAISLGHDIGHTPFGHAGERKLSQLYHDNTGRFFHHNVHSVRVLDYIFPQNISLQTLDGILCHNGEMELEAYRPKPYADFDILDKKVEECYLEDTAMKQLIPATLEGCVMRISDIIAYLGKDRQDARKLKIFSEEPDYQNNVIGTTNAQIINNMIVNIIENSYGKDYIRMDPEYFKAFSLAKKENSKLIYMDEKTDQIYEETLNPMMEELYYKLLDDAKSMNKNTVFYRHHIEYIREITRYSFQEKDYRETPPNDMVVDYIAAMTDDYMVDLYDYLFPKGKYQVKYRGYFDEL